MRLALRTGWTEDTILDGISDEFRRACHHAMYVEHAAADLAEARELASKASSIDVTDLPTAERSAARVAIAGALEHYAALRRAFGLDEPLEEAADV